MEPVVTTLPLNTKRILLRKRQFCLKTELFPHQKDFLTQGLRWEKKGKHGGLLGAEMGTGKTLMILSLFAKNLTLHNIPYRTIVVAPLSLIHNWHREFQKHLDIESQRVLVYHGKNRHLTPFTGKWMIITTYETVRQDMMRWGEESPLIKFAPDRIVLDEAHEIKNSKTQRFRACLKLPGRFRWAMTGTPIQNYRSDLESLTQFIGLEPYCDPAWWNQGNIDEWKSESYIYYAKSDLNLNLPRSTTHYHELEFSDAEAKLYYHMKTEAQELFDEYLNNGALMRFTVLLTKILRLRQVCNHPYAPLSAEQRKQEKPISSSTKLDKIVEIVQNTPKDEKVLIFSQFVNSLELIGESLDLNGFKGQHLCYHGGLTGDAKEKILKDFEKSDKKILCMSVKAGGVGLNLVCANHVILVDPWWNSPVESQALARVDRIGQLKEVHIHRLSMKNSVESWILMLQNHKAQEAANILSKDPTIKQQNNFSYDDVRKLFNTLF